MSAIFGPNSYMSGQKLPCPKNQECDNHPEIKAVVRIVGECDSFGSEMSDFCEDCLELYEATADERSGVCDFCGCHVEHIRPYRDPDEGSTGPVYDVCDPCISKQKATEDYAENRDPEVDDIDDGDTDHYRDLEDDGYSLEPTEGDPEPLNFHNPSHRW